MANSYASLYLSDVLDKVKDVALAVMMHPSYTDTSNGMTAHNERIAIYNDGIRDLVQALKHELVKMTEEEESK